VQLAALDDRLHGAIVPDPVCRPPPGIADLTSIAIGLHKYDVIDMLICMRTTILLPDELYAEVRRLARDEEATITSVIERSLRAEIRRAQSPPKVAAYQIRALGGGRVRPGVDLRDNADVLSRMEGADAS
jgi:hypothetical protein